jgi:hypothetical protein
MQMPLLTTFFRFSECGFWSAVAAIGLLSLVVSGGCSSTGYYPVQGKVVDSAGQPIPGLEGSEIVFTLVGGQTSSIAQIEDDGSFKLFTDKPGDGAPPGEYQVYIPRRRIDTERAAPQVIDAKYEQPETSDLKATVENKRNNFEFKVAKVVKRGA